MPYDENGNWTNPLSDEQTFGYFTPPGTEIAMGYGDNPAPTLNPSPGDSEYQIKDLPTGKTASDATARSSVVGPSRVYSYGSPLPSYRSPSEVAQFAGQFTGAMPAPAARPVTPLTLRTSDPQAVSSETQVQAAPAISKLRKALMHVSTVAANEDNPAKKRDTLRAAMEGTGTSLGSIMLSAHNIAGKKVAEDTSIANQQAVMNWQAENANIQAEDTRKYNEWSTLYQNAIRDFFGSGNVRTTNDRRSTNNTAYGG